MKEEVIFNLYPSAVTVGNEGEFVLDKDQNPIKIDEKKVEEEYKKLKLEHDALQYQRDRKYPEITDQLDMIYWDKKNGTKKWEEAIDKIKKDFPKPE